ncbi:four-helix bundle copper-binding protein [Paenibacillus apis]|uniref:four-helix bundle copper-binding protein n=1 Tax=Paenibacillus apis TaxID=1792174 RepID=UPI002659EF1B|nr:four-helix bundle copper-binding protein [Paenibacillus apis]
MIQEKYRECIEACLACMNACNYCYVSSLKEYELAMLRECIRLDRECADICAFTAEALSRNTLFALEISALCAKACDACAEECEKHSHDHCHQCAEACRRCAEACRQMIGAA